MRLAVAAALLLAAAAAGCAHDSRRPTGPELFAVLPGQSGHVGAIVVRASGPEQVLDQAYAASRVDTDGSAALAKLSPEVIRRDFGGMIDSLPGRPASFTLYFLEGKDELTPASRLEMEKVFAELKRRPAPDIVVIGHTDTGFTDSVPLVALLLMVLLLYILGVRRWSRLVTIALCTAGMSYVLFVRWLQIPLPTAAFGL